MQVKRLIRILALLLAVGTLSACGSQGEDGKGEEKTEDNMKNYEMYAEIINTGEKIEVNVYEAEYAEGIYWLNTDEKTAIKDRDGNKISISELKAGDKIKITYSGQVMMSYPPQVYAIGIEITSP